MTTQQDQYLSSLSTGELTPSSLLQSLSTDSTHIHDAIHALLLYSQKHISTVATALSHHLTSLYQHPHIHTHTHTPSQANGIKYDSSQISPPGTRLTTPVERSDDPIQRVEIALSAIRQGEFVVVADSADRENEADLIIAAEHATPEKLAFMINETSGMICVGVAGERLDELKLPQMVQHNTESHSTAFTVSVDYKIGTTTGISAADRAATIKALATRSVSAEMFNRPGHIFPLRAREGGVLVRGGHTEASVDLARLAGCFPAGALCEIVNKDGSMTRPTHINEFAQRHNLAICSIADLLYYRKIKENIQ